MTHAELVTIAVRWLKRTVRCGVVLAEAPAICGESPDAIGWRSAFSVMVECKVSRADFLADQAKDGRAEGRRLAHKCYYMTSPGLLRADEIPAKWGLLEVRGGKVFIVRDVPENLQWSDDRAGSELRDEVLLLYGELRRYQVQGITYKTMTGKVAQEHLITEPPLFAMDPDSPHDTERT